MSCIWSRDKRSAMVWAQNPSYLGGLGRRISEFEPSMVYIESPRTARAI